MASQEGVCWQCRAEWAAEEGPRTTLRAIAGGQSASPVAELAGAEARLQTDRWMDEGGSVGPERVVAGRRAAVATG
jgi:hypothetical protein